MYGGRRYTCGGFVFGFVMGYVNAVFVKDIMYRAPLCCTTYLLLWTSGPVIIRQKLLKLK